MEESGATLAEQSSPTPPKLPIFTISPPQSPEPSGMLTPPLHPSAAVPFKWEEQPGKPFPCTAIIPCPPQPNTKKSLELPPRLQLMDLYSKMTKMPSPTTVLDGPYLGKTVTPLSSSSFRFSRERQGSFGSSSTCGSPEKAMVLSKKVAESSSKERCFLGSWRRKSTQKWGEEEDEDEGSLVFLPPLDLEGFGDADGCTRVKMSRIKRRGSNSSLYHVRSHFWANIYDGFKNVLPWKSRKLKKDRVFV